MTAREEAIARKVAESEEGRCASPPKNDLWCSWHESRWNKGYDVCLRMAEYIRLAEEAIDEAEPIIRADEREQDWRKHWRYGAVEAEVRDRLRAQVMALPERADAHDEDCPGRPGRRGICNCEGDILISRRAALALLGGESNGS